MKLFHKQYMIQASVERFIRTTDNDGWTSVQYLPMFILDAGIQGIISTEHAKEIAESMLTKALVMESSNGRTIQSKVNVWAQEFEPMMEGEI